MLRRPTSRQTSVLIVLSVDWLDGGMITLATFTINIFYPGFLLGPGPTWKNEREVAASDVETADHGSSTQGEPSRS